MARCGVVAAMVLVLVVGACSGDDSGGAGTTVAVTGGETSAITQAGGTLLDRPCDSAPWLPPTKCYFLKVPERRDVAGSPRISLWVDVVTPDGVVPGALPLVWLTGGPGDAASVILDHRLTFTGTPRPLVFVDQRGTGRSEPRLDCPELDALAIDGRQPWDARVDAARAAVQTCRAGLVAAGVDLDGYNTAEDVADIVDLRKALGYDQWLVYGLSYGGRLAQQVLAADEKGVAGVILDSSITSEPLGPASLLDRAKDAIARLSDACAAEASCRQNTPDLVATFDAAVARMDATPYVSTAKNADGSPIVVSGREVVAGAFNAQYDRDLIAILPGAAKAIAEGQTGIIDGLAAKLTMDEDTATGLFAASLCADDGAQLSAADQSVLADPGEYGSLLLGWPYPVCDVWDVLPVRGGPLKAPVSDVPVLLMEGGLDPVAPARFADSIKAHLTHATVVVVPAGGHGNAFGTDCAANISAAFLDDPSATLDTSCVASLPPPFAN
jgi:pimeloyl-ACP methyl ester carboxylesterase